MMSILMNRLFGISKKAYNKEKTGFTSILIKILKKLCKMVDTDFKKMNFAKENWYLQHEWTNEQENEFRIWLTSLLKHSSKARNSIMIHNIKDDVFISKFVESFILFYGWKLK